MDINLLIDQLSLKYNYDERTINALKKIIPALIEYYGVKYSDIIKDSLLNCEIIHCDSYHTISKTLEENGLINHLDNYKNSDGIYVSKPNISYDSVNNSFVFGDVIRKIIVSHTFNFDSPKGLEVLTNQICKLIKSYKLEYKIIDNELYKYNGLFTEKNNIILNKDGLIELFSIEKNNEALEMGFNLYDTDKIVSIILKDNYKSYSYDSIATVAMILKDKFKFNELINEEEILKTGFFNVENNSFSKLSSLVDECYFIEEEMLMYSYTRDKKDELQSRLSELLSGDVYNSLIELMINNKKRV